MYAPRQNKKAVSRQIDVGFDRTKYTSQNKKNDNLIKSPLANNHVPIQRSLKVLEHEMQDLSYSIIYNNQESRGQLPVAKTVKVLLIPDDESSKGTAPGQSRPHDEFMSILNDKHPDVGFIRGHLLNDNLGGPGTWENMFPISSEANANHLNQVERPVKRLLINQYNEQQRSAIHYCVTVQTDSDNFIETPTAYIHCEWGLVDNDINEVNIGCVDIESSAEQTKKQNKRLEELGWGSFGKGNAKHAKFVRLCKELQINCLENGLDNTILINSCGNNFIVDSDGNSFQED